MKVFIAAFALLVATVAMGQKTCVGKWVTIDDKTGKHKSIVELYKEDGKLYGKIRYLFPREGRGPNPKCTKCEDDRKDQPLMGLQIVRDLKWNGSEWAKGTIVDPENGKIYKVKMWLDNENDRKLHVRGYLGPIYRTQNWIRMKDEPKK